VICTRESLLEQIRAAEERTLRSVRYQLLLSTKHLQQRGLQRAESLIHRVINSRSQQVDDFDFRLRSTARGMFAAHRRAVESLDARLRALDLRVRFARAHARLDQAEAQLDRCSNSQLGKLRQRLESLQAHLTQLSPLAVLGRGYAIVRRNNGAVLRKAAETVPGEPLHVRLASGRLQARVETIEAGE
jgi:exodeoxyribonuclease VII large subunit